MTNVPICFRTEIKNDKRFKTGWCFMCLKAVNMLGVRGFAIYVGYTICKLSLFLKYTF